MDKVNLKRFATANYDRQAYNNVLTQIEQQLNVAADGYLFNATSVTSAYTANYSDSLILVDCTDGAVTVTLQPALEVNKKRITIKKVDASANAVTVTPGGTETIDGVASKSLAAQWNYIELMAFGGAWYVVG